MNDQQEARLPTHLWIEAEIRALTSRGIGVYVTAKGDAGGGLVLQKISNMTGLSRVLVLQRNFDGKLEWVNALDADTVPEKEADDYIRRAIDRDPDLWVIEIEDRSLEMSITTFPAL